MRTMLTPASIVAGLDQLVVGQREAKEDLANALWLQSIRSDWKRSGRAVDRLGPKKNVLIVGPRGCGKSLLVESAARLVAIPYHRIDIAQLAIPGGDGLQIEDAVASMLDRSAAEIDVLEAGIVMLDGVDKIAASQRPFGQAIQNALLGIVDGRSIRVAHQGRMRDINTTDMLFIACGSFAGPTGGVPAKNMIGFEGAARTIGTLALGDDDYIAAGLSPDLLARFAIRTYVEYLDQEDLVAILQHPNCSPLEDYKHLFSSYGVKLDVEPEAISEIAAGAQSRGAGARTLAPLLSDLLEEIVFELPDLAGQGVSRVFVSAAAVRGEEQLFKEVTLSATPAALSPEDSVAGPSITPEPPIVIPTELLPSRSPRAGAGVHGSGRWATSADLVHWSDPESAGPHATVLPNATLLVETRADGSAVGPLPSRSFVIPSKRRRQHLLCVGKTGSGKTQRLVLPLLASDIRDADRTVVVIDAQMDLVHRALAMTREFRGPDGRFIYLNFRDPGRTTAWNPIQGISGRMEAYEIASSIGAGIPEGRGDSPFFRNAAIQLLASVIRGLNKVLCGNASLGHVRDLVDAGSAALIKLGHEAAMPELEAISANSENANFRTTIMELQNMLGAWYDPTVCACTAASEFDFESLETQPTVLVLGMAEEDVTRLKPLTNAFVQRLLAFVMSRGSARPGGELLRPFSLIIDEFASAVGRLGELDARINTLRKRNLSLVAAVQSLAQVQNVYQDAAESLLVGFNSHLLIPPLDEYDGEFGARRSGVTTVLEITTRDGRRATQITPISRHVLNASDIANPLGHPQLGPRVTFLLPETPPFQGYLQAMYENSETRHFLDDRIHEQHALVAREDGGLLWPPRTGSGGTDLGATGLGVVSLDDVTRIGELKRDRLDWDQTVGSAKAWWSAFETENAHRPALVRLLCEILAGQTTTYKIDPPATITEFFLAYVYSNTENIQANLHYLMYTRLKKESAKKAAESQGAGGGGDGAG